MECSMNKLDLLRLSELALKILNNELSQQEVVEYLALLKQWNHVVGNKKLSKF